MMRASSERQRREKRRLSPAVASVLRVAGYALLAIASSARSGRRPPADLLETAETDRRPRSGALEDAGADRRAAIPPKSKRGIWPLLKETVSRWSNHKASRLGAALAYYSVFSLGPLLVVVVAIAGLAFGQEAVRGQLSDQLKGLLGDTGAQGIEAMLAGASKPSEGIVATVLGAATLLFAAIGVVVQLKDALNSIWDVQGPKVSGIWSFIRTYIVSLAGVLALGFLLLMSLVITSGLAAAGKYLAAYVPEAALQIVSFLLSFGIITLLFAMMFKWLPDAPIRWSDVWLGAVVTAALFEAGKFAIGLYIGKQGLESTFGAAASIVVVLIWVYYSAQLILLGAEFTRVYADWYGSRRQAA